MKGGQPEEEKLFSSPARRRAYLRWIGGAVAALLLAVSVAKLEGYRDGIERVAVVAGETPGTLYRLPGSDGPLVVIAHGFAGSRQLMEAISLTLARSGYAALAFDFQGHGRNPAPMGGDVTSIDGTTVLLVAEIRRVMDAGLELTGWRGPVALVGHSMASDIVVRAGIADARVGPIIAISMFSQAVSADEPRNLLVLTGEWEPGLRQEALKALRLVDPSAQEGGTAVSESATRRAVAAPHVEHVGVLYSVTTLRETLDWLDEFFARPQSEGAIAQTGGWIVLLLISIVAVGWSLAALLPDKGRAQPVLLRPFLVCVVVPALAVPLIATRIDASFLPVLVADYLALHLLLYGGMQLAILWWAGIRPGAPRAVPMAALLIYGLGAFALALDHYVANFVPHGPRLIVFAGIALGAVPFMLADSMLAEAGHARLWRRVFLRFGILASLALAVWIDFERLMFLVIILPILVLFFVVFGLLGRWVGLRSGPFPVGLALGVILAWSLAATFPLFEP